MDAALPYVVVFLAGMVVGLILGVWAVTGGDE